MNVLFKSSDGFSSLSLKDLIEARDLFHYHLMNKKNVVATAVGLYRIRRGDPWPNKGHPKENTHSSKGDRRTLFNSEIRPYSWPCVYAFVSDWQQESDLSRKNPSDVVSKSLFRPDGRVVPVCVIEARRQDLATDLQVSGVSRLPRNVLGPGSPIINEDSQGITRLATAGCIVRDGEEYYVLTNRHAAGAAGTVIRALQNNRLPEIGVTSAKGLTREDFKKVYPHFQSTSQRLLQDVGLIDLDDILQWKTAVPGIAPIGPVLDLYDNNFSLKLISMKVVGVSAVTGYMRGEIQGLFYRYKSMGGYDYVSDFLIGPETHGISEKRIEEGLSAEKRKNINVGLMVHHGDSGTVLHVEHRDTPEAEPVYFPFALLWGKEQILEDNTPKSHPFALATSLSTALDKLNLDIVRDINLDQEYVWGWVGHYAIGRSLALATSAIKSASLRAFIGSNLDLLAVNPDSALGNDPKVLTSPGGQPNFVPLADVPDNVWKSNVNFVMVEGDDGKKHRKPGPGNRGKDDNPNHFADLDLVYLGGKTFLQLNAGAAATYLKPSEWIKYFAAMKPQWDAWDKLLNPAGATAGAKAKNQSTSNHWGALPFRVHQLFDIMVKAAKSGDQPLFLAAGGVLIHYMRDACQPLHTSYLSQGDPAQVVKRPKSDGMKLQADGVHSGYEDDMIAYGYQQKNLASSLKSAIAAFKSAGLPAIANGFDASKAVIDLVQATQSDIHPRAIVDKWVELAGTPKKQKAALMWKAFGAKTIVCMARGTCYLAAIWQAAWSLGNGDTKIGKGAKQKPGAIMKIYNDPDKLPSVALDRYQDFETAADWSGITRKTH